MGMAKAPVLPDPVSAKPMMSRFCVRKKNLIYTMTDSWTYLEAYLIGLTEAAILILADTELNQKWPIVTKPIKTEPIFLYIL